MKSAFWKTDWFLGTVVVLAVLTFSKFSDLIPSLDPVDGVAQSTRWTGHVTDPPSG